MLFSLGLLLIVACCFVFSCKSSNGNTLRLLPFFPSNHRKNLLIPSHVLYRFIIEREMTPSLLTGSVIVLCVFFACLRK